jgi:hypothetical protein
MPKFFGPHMQHLWRGIRDKIVSESKHYCVKLDRTGQALGRIETILPLIPLHKHLCTEMHEFCLAQQTSCLHVFLSKLKPTYLPPPPTHPPPPIINTKYFPSISSVFPILEGGIRTMTVLHIFKEIHIELQKLFIPLLVFLYFLFLSRQ